MNYKKLRNIIALVGVMVALIPTFLYYAQGTFYGAQFSFITASIGLVCFMGACLMQMLDNKKNGLPITGPLIPLIGFAFVLGYIWILLAR